MMVKNLLPADASSVGPCFADEDSITDVWYFVFFLPSSVCFKCVASHNISELNVHSTFVSFFLRFMFYQS